MATTYSGAGSYTYAYFSSSNRTSGPRTNQRTVSLADTTASTVRTASNHLVHAKPVPLSLTDFTSLCDVDPGDVDVDEDFMVPLVIAGHTWCCISSVDYYVWLKRTPNTGDEGSPPVSTIRVDPDTAVEQSDWSAHGELPGNKNLDHFDRLLNKGLEMIRLDIMWFCQEIAICHNLPADYSGLEKSICLPPSWDHFHSALVNAREITAHARFMHWYKDSFRGKKRRTTEPDIKSGDSGDQEGKPIHKRTVGGWEVGQRHVQSHVSDVLSGFDFDSRQKWSIKGRPSSRTALPEGPDAVQCPEILGPRKRRPPAASHLRKMIQTLLQRLLEIQHQSYPQHPWG
ncbi:hypothetical protein EDD15DRAFT_2202465 [Pisolithus albus]|nr:hypothetical protein EDD15DRAFT_2202465 [Pisolithus albus]